MSSIWRQVADHAYDAETSTICLLLRCLIQESITVASMANLVPKSSEYLKKLEIERREFVCGCVPWQLLASRVLHAAGALSFLNSAFGLILAIIPYGAYYTFK